MSVLYWGRGFDNFSERLARHPGNGGGCEGLFQIANLAELRASLAARHADLHFVVLAPSTHDELNELVALASLLSGIAIIVLLPSSERETIALAHRLRPRFVLPANGDLDEAVAVVVNILNNAKGFE